MNTLKELLQTLPQHGTVSWLGLRPARRATMLEVDTIAVNPKDGIEGDRYQGRSGKRHITLIQAEHLPVIESCAQQGPVHPAMLRRNILVSGINLLALKKQLVCVGEVVIEVTGDCHPCSYMEEVLGPGGYNAMRGHGGVTARVITAGNIHLNDEIYLQTN